MSTVDSAVTTLCITNVQPYELYCASHCIGGAWACRTPASRGHWQISSPTCRGRAFLTALQGSGEPNTHEARRLRGEATPHPPDRRLRGRDNSHETIGPPSPTLTKSRTQFGYPNFRTHPTNVAIPTIRFQHLKGLHGNCVRLLENIGHTPPLEALCPHQHYAWPLARPNTHAPEHRTRT